MILCCGEALIDLIPSASGDTALVGGSVLNTAVALGRLGARTGLLTGLSSDTYGAMIEAHLTESHVDTSLAIRSDRPTTLAVVRFENGQPRYEFRDEGSALRMLTPDDLPSLPEHVTAMVFGGISLIPTPVADTMARACTDRPAGVVALVDANIRPDFIDDPEAYRARLGRMIASANMVKVSDEDLDWLIPDSSDQIGALMSQGPDLVLLTRGAEGAQAHTSAGVTARVASERTEVVDTVGAGDTFNAGVLKSLADQHALTPEAIRALSEDALVAALSLGARAAAVTVSRAGANPPWQSELER